MIIDINVRDFIEFFNETPQQYATTVVWADTDFDIDGINTVSNIYIHPLEGDTLKIPLNLEETQRLYEEWLNTRG